MEQNILSEGQLLDAKGNLNEAGFAYSLVKQYQRDKIKASKWRIKEWDYYYMGDEEYGIALTIDDNSYMGLVSASILDFKNKKYINCARMYWFCNGKVNLPNTSKDGSVTKNGKDYSFSFENNNGSRHLKVKIKNMVKNKDFVADIKLEESSKNSMVIATPFLKPKHFYYNQKINNLIVEGEFSFGEISHKFHEDTLGVLDWGRGVWTYKNTWFWSSLSVVQEGKKIGFNLGYGFGDTSKASENMLFIDDKAYKLNDVKFNIPQKNKKDDFMSCWTITSSDSAIDMTFTPLLDRHDKTNAIIISQDAHQVFGYFNGTIRYSEGTINIKNALGFAEKVKNKW